MTQDLPSLNVSTPEPPAFEAAETLLGGFHLQDMRESHLVACDVAAARSAASAAVEHMVTAFGFEFPAVSRSRTARAAESFMRALFVQDEIENRVAFGGRAERGRSADVFVSSLGDVTGAPSIDDDLRWSEVRGLLRTVCDDPDMDPKYAALHTRFWRRHGQRHDSWETIAW
ncbi:hypothetical protein C440_00325 [Haloferax mucosum ATCC BAA-1512]|uniref:Uncharacterized protein n=1 Tax=Haloferax mucosum ATCC BAA-1512 TaxID=662479 RepID=M0IPU2_9EURY|nr:hypothetical protein [Haloferax mucosum]ELZ98755.1 hypothetical protein C440_00325 [Haloferax mucosum ATCC BAA-1512]